MNKQAQTWQRTQEPDINESNSLSWLWWSGATGLQLIMSSHATYPLPMPDYPGRVCHHPCHQSWVSCAPFHGVCAQLQRSPLGLPTSKLAFMPHHGWWHSQNMLARIHTHFILSLKSVLLHLKSRFQFKKWSLDSCGSKTEGSLIYTPLYITVVSVKWQESQENFYLCTDSKTPMIKVMLKTFCLA